MTGQVANQAEAAWFAEKCERIVGNVERAIRGKNEIVRLAALCMAAEGHVLLSDVPGVGKTTLAKALANSVDGQVRRVQCTPDLLPADITGVTIFNVASREFEFRPGPVFGNVVLADEVNRASPKTQSALLEVMEERQVTVDGTSHAVPRPFLVIATQNPVEHGGTYDLPEAQIDRFMMRLSVGYPDHASERDLIGARVAGESARDLAPVATAADLERMARILRGVQVTPQILDYIVTVLRATRTLGQLRLGASPRAGIALASAAQAHAAADGRPFVTPDDVKALAPFVLAHRMLLRPEAELGGTSAEGLLGEILASVPVPGLRPAYR